MSVLPTIGIRSNVQWHMRHSRPSALLVRRRLEGIVSRVVAEVKSRIGCQCRVSTEFITTTSGDSRVQVWAIAPCRIHMAAGLPSESSLAREIELESNAQIARM